MQVPQATSPRAKPQLGERRCATAPQRVPPQFPLDGLPSAVAAHLHALPTQTSVLVRWPSPQAALARTGGHLLAVPVDSLQDFRGRFGCVADAGELQRCGFIMDLHAYRWDVLGRVEEALCGIAELLFLVQPGGQLLVHVAGKPVEYLVGYLEAFPVTVRCCSATQSGTANSTICSDAIGAGGCRGSAAEVQLCICEVGEQITPRHLAAVIAREISEERSHRRYAAILDTTLAELAAVGTEALGSTLSILDVGGGDGHMAEWWAASGHEIFLLEVDSEEAQKARHRLGEDRVTLHDGVSAWPFADGSFDVCLLLFVLHHIADEASVLRTLAEAARICRRRILVLEDQPREACTPGLCQLAAAVTAEHFRPFNQDPAKFMRNIRSDEAWRTLFSSSGMTVESASRIAGTLQHPVPHTFYVLRPLHCGDKR